MARKSKPTLRTGLKWRDGRPRWEPSPANRALGIKGVDLKDVDQAGAERWLEHGEALDVCAARTTAARILREAAAGDAAALKAIRAVVARLRGSEPPRTDVERLRRRYTADLVDRAAALAVGDADPFSTPTAAIPRSGRALVEAYFADPLHADPVHGLSPATLRNYRTQSRRFLARFADTQVAAITKGDLRAWYLELSQTTSLSTAKLILAVASAFLAWAALHDWITASPAARLKLKKAPGRRVFWTVEEEQAFVPWCDANGFEDVADAAILGLWTGARSADMCLADMADLKGDVWPYTPHKTRRSSGREAMPGLLQPVKDRLARPRPMAPIDGAFLFHPATGARHDSDSLGDRYREARIGVVADGVLPAAFLGKMLKDTRKTCLTRLWLSGVEAAKIFGWTGHSPSEGLDILRDHYLVLQAEGSAAMAGQLKAWAQGAGLVL